VCQLLVTQFDGLQGARRRTGKEAARAGRCKVIEKSSKSEREREQLMPADQIESANMVANCRKRAERDRLTCCSNRRKKRTKVIVNETIALPVRTRPTGAEVE
jgi:hypothetical protein